MLYYLAVSTVLNKRRNWNIMALLDSEETRITEILVIEDDPREVENIVEELGGYKVAHLKNAYEWTKLRDSGSPLPGVVLIDCMIPGSSHAGVEAELHPYGVAIALECIVSGVPFVAIVSKDCHDSNLVPAYLRRLFRRREHGEPGSCANCRCVSTYVGNTHFITAFEAIKNPGPNRLKAWRHVLAHLID